jgi:hypothetical protein
MEKLLLDVVFVRQVQCQKYFMIMQASSGALEVHSTRLMLQMERQAVSMNLSFVLPLGSTESLERWMFTILLVSIVTIHS